MSSVGQLLRALWQVRLVEQAAVVEGGALAASGRLEPTTHDLCPFEERVHLRQPALGYPTKLLARIAGEE